MSFWGELRRRNVVRVGIAYIVAAWLVMQVADTFFPALQLPEWTVTFVAAILLLGFPVAIAISWAYEMTPEGLKKTHEVPPSESITKTTGRRIDRAIIAVLAVAVVFLVVDNYVPNDSGETTLASEQVAENAVDDDSTTTVGDARMPNSVAVLPFENLSPSEENAYFAIGLHEEVLNQLFKLSNLSVISRTSMLRYSDSNLSVPDIARELNVETVMEGSVRYADGRIRATMQLIDAETDQHLWSETYEAEFEDIFAIESDIAMNVANALRAEFSLAEQAAIEEVPTTSSVAYALYLQARSIWSVGGAATETLDLLDRALAVDPDFADAYGLKAQVLTASFANTTQGDGVATESREALERSIRELAGTALELDPVNSAARSALRNINLLTWRWTAFEQGIEPRDRASLLTVQLWVFAWMERRAEAVRMAERVVELNPNDAAAHMTLGILYGYAGDRNASTASLRRAEELLPADALIHAWLAYNDIVTENTQTALEKLRLVERLVGQNGPIVYLPELAYSYSRLGRPEEAERFLDEIESRATETEVGAGTWAVAYLAIGDDARTLEQLEIVAEKARNHEPDQGYLNVMNLKMNYLDDPRLRQPEFVDVLSRITGD